MADRIRAGCGQRGFESSIQTEIGLTLMNELLLNYENRDKIYDFVSSTKV